MVVTGTLPVFNLTMKGNSQVIKPQIITQPCTAAGSCRFQLILNDFFFKKRLGFWEIRLSLQCYDNNKLDEHLYFLAVSWVMFFFRFLYLCLYYFSAVSCEFLILS